MIWCDEGKKGTSDAMYSVSRNGKARKGRIKNLLLSMLFLCIIALTLVLGGRFFAVKNIKIAGNDTISSSEILDVTCIYYEKNLLRIKGETVKMLLTAVFPIKEVKVSYKLPATLVIEIEERKAAAAMDFSGGFVLVDDSGVTVAVKQKINGRQIPIITGFDILEAEVAKTPVIKGEEDHFNIAMELVGLLSYMSSELSEVHAEYDDGGDTVFSLYTLDGYRVNLGKFNPVKIAIIKDVLDDIRGNYRGKGVLDLSFDSPVFKPFEYSSPFE